MRLNHLEQALDLSLEMDLYTKAEEIAKTHFKKRLPDVYFKHAVALEEDGHFQEAEEEFIKAGKPKEAIGISLLFCFHIKWFDCCYICISINAIGSTLPGIQFLVYLFSFSFFSELQRHSNRQDCLKCLRHRAE